MVHGRPDAARALCSRRSLLAAFASAPVAAAFPISVSSGVITPSLRRAADARGVFFGAALRIEQVEREPGLRSSIETDCSWVTPEIHMKWDAIEPVAGAFRFEHADGLVAFAEQRGLGVRGHTLLWEQSTPAWAKRSLDWDLVETFFEATLSRYGDRVAQWDVVNESIDTENGAKGLRRSIFHKAFGPTYIERALHSARAHAPHAALFINDYGFDYENPVEQARRTAMLRLVEHLKRVGAPLDGVGVQAHLDLSKGPIAQRAIGDFLQALADFGLDIVITELDVKEADHSLPIDKRDAAVAAEARTFLDVALAQPAVKGVVTWGLSDRHSWLSEMDGPQNRGLPYDEKFERKPMYWAMHGAFGKARRSV